MIMSVGRLSDQQVETVLNAADAAPWRNGERPWHFQCTSGSFELYGEDDAEHLLACGGALLNLRLAVQDLGVSADVLLSPDPMNPELLAVVRTENERLATTWERQLAKASVLRDVPTAATLTPDAALPELRRAAEIEQAWLAPLSPDTTTAIHVPDGGALVVVVGSLHDDVRALLRAGQAIRRVVLTAATLGLRTSTLTEPVATATSRAELRSLIGGALFPHAVLAIDV